MAKAYVKHDYAVTGRDYVETEGGDTPAGGGINYSTDEQDTGLKWIDDRAVYQKTFTGSTAANTDHTVISEELTQTTCEIVGSSMSVGANASAGYVNSSNYCGLWLGSSTLSIYHPSGVSENYIVTVRYVKTE